MEKYLKSKEGEMEKYLKSKEGEMEKYLKSKEGEMEKYLKSKEREMILISPLTACGEGSGVGLMIGSGIFRIVLSDMSN